MELSTIYSLITNTKKTRFTHYIVIKNEIVTIYSVFYLILYPQQVILDIREKNESVTADTQKIFQQNK